MELMNAFVELAAIDVGKHIEKKSNLSYLSWAWAVDQLMRADPAANWEFHEPAKFGKTLMVSCTVTAFGKPIRMHLPVMDHRNKAVEDPDAFVVNKNMMRCLVKAIACHGLGLYIYAGEDLPSDEDGNRTSTPQKPPIDLTPYLAAMDAAKSTKALSAAYKEAWEATEDERVTAHYEKIVAAHADAIAAAKKGA